MIEINPRFLHVFAIKILKAVFILVIIYHQDCLSAQTNSLKNSIRVYNAVYINEKLKIDGLLDEHAWQDAPFTENFVVNDNGAAPKLITKAQMVWDDNSLYIALRIIDNDIWSTLKEHDDPLWKQEAIEIFLDPDGDGQDYIELQVNAIGTTLDLVMDKEYDKGGRGNPVWTLVGLEVGIKVNGTINSNGQDKSWICEIAIPFCSISVQLEGSTPKIGDIWRINLCRIERDRLDNHSFEALAWNPTYSTGFHLPDKFGQVIFTDKLIKRGAN